MNRKGDAQKPQEFLIDGKPVSVVAVPLIKLTPAPPGFVDEEALAKPHRKVPPSILALADSFCGCGRPELAWAWVKWYLALCEAQKRFPSDDYNEEVYGGDLIAAYVVHHLGLTTHGGAIWNSWLTDEGIGALAFLRENGSRWWDKPGDPWLDERGIFYGPTDPDDWQPDQEPAGPPT